jgi:uncharacterized protein
MAPMTDAAAKAAPVGPQATWLDGGRLHLNHGPIDLILWADGPDAALALDQAQTFFSAVLETICAELPALRSADMRPVSGPVAQAMRRATAPFRPAFITPMAAVAGAVADAVLAAMTAGTRLDRAYVNNGGDIAVHLAPGRSLSVALGLSAGRVTLTPDMGCAGVATSGWRGRSWSLGIADAVTVLAPTAAMADAAATMIANAVDLPHHPGISRRPAHDLQHDSDLGARLVTCAVPPLSAMERAAALTSGAGLAASCLSRGLIHSAVLFLQGDCRVVGTPSSLYLPSEPEPAHG